MDSALRADAHWQSELRSIVKCCQCCSAKKRIVPYRILVWYNHTQPILIFPFTPINHHCVHMCCLCVSALLV